MKLWVKCIQSVALCLVGLLLVGLFPSATDRVLAEDQVSETLVSSSIEEEQWGNELEYIFNYLYPWC